MTDEDKVKNTIHRAKKTVEIFEDIMSVMENVEGTWTVPANLDNTQKVKILADTAVIKDELLTMTVCVGKIQDALRADLDTAIFGTTN